MTAFLVRTLPSGAVALGGFLDQVSRTTIWARLRDDAVPTGELTLGIASAAEENLAAAAAPFENFALFAIGAGERRC